jgi:hypothetical protein
LPNRRLYNNQFGTFRRVAYLAFYGMAYSYPLPAHFHHIEIDRRGRPLRGAHYMNPKFFNDQTCHFQTLRALNDIPYGGADTSEVLETIKHIRAGDFDSWYGAWERTGDRVSELAYSTIDPISRGRAHLRAHNYYRTAEFLLAPDDSRRAMSLGVSYERIRAPYGAHHLNTLYFPGPRGFAGEEDHFVPFEQVKQFENSLTQARSVTSVVYDRESGGAEHCQFGAITLWHAAFFDWLLQKFPAARSSKTGPALEHSP